MSHSSFNLYSTNDIEHIFMFLLAICVSLEKYLFKFFEHF